MALAATVAKRLGHAEALSRGLFRAIFVEPATEKIDLEECTRRAEKAGIPRDRFHSALRSRETVAEHEKTLEEALSLGAFGVPTFVVDGELFWGNDRLVLLKEHLLADSSGSGSFRG